ncbi:MAG: caspase family protein [Bacteroidota bacterium]
MRRALHFVVDTPTGPEAIGFDQLKDRYYDPGLLAKLLGYSDEPLRDVQGMNERGLHLPPEVHLTAPEDALATGQPVTLTLINRGDGIGAVQVLLNGREVLADARPRGADPAADSLTLTLDLSGHPFLLPGQDNTIEVSALDGEEGYVRSRSGSLVLRAREDADAEPPSLYALVVGTSDYAGYDLDLRFAAKDAADLATALEVAGGRLFGTDRTQIRLLSTEPGERTPTSAEIRAAFSEIAAEATSRDVLVVYLAGHGVADDATDDFYYLTRDALSSTLTDPALREAVALSGAELTDLILSVPTQRQVFILDACYSGTVVAQQLAAARQIDGETARIRSLDRLQDRTGMFVLAGSAADAVSYEASRYGQGLLTYSLLMGMRGAALREGVEVDVATLVGYAQDRVPELAAGIGGIQRPQAFVPSGGSFPIGQVLDEDQAAIPLALEKPLVLRANLTQEGTRSRDPLGLTGLVDEALRSASARGREAPLVFVDADAFADAYYVGGLYDVEGDQVTVEVEVYQGDDSGPVAEVTGTSADLSSLAAGVRDAVERLLLGIE